MKVRRFAIEDVGFILQPIYESEINVSVSWVADRGYFDWQIDDVEDLPPEIEYIIKSGAADPTNIADTISILAYAVTLLYPGSTFAEWYEDERIVLTVNPN